MSCRNAALAVLLVLPFGAPFAEAAGLTFACEENNDVYRAVAGAGGNPSRFARPDEAIAAAAEGSAVLLLADGYPSATLRVEPKSWDRAREKRLRVYVEFSQSVPRVELGPAKSAVWDRVVVTAASLPQPLTRHRILAAQGCSFLPVTSEVESALLVLARVAGYDTAVFGLPRQSFPLLFRSPDGHLVATTKLSGFITGRYAPTAEWVALWRYILASLQPDSPAPDLAVEPRVRPAYGKDERLPSDAERRALARYASWLRRGGLLVPLSGRDAVNKLLAGGAETTDPPAADEPAGDGSLGLLEGYASHIRPDGSQPRRLPLRADCHGEAAMVLALDAALEGDPSNAHTAANLLDFVHARSGMHRGAFGDPRHPAFGLIAWGDVAPAWTVATYGDDNARALLGTIAAAASLGSDHWDAAVVKGLLANLRTTGRLGFRGDRIDVPALEKNGWKHYHDADTLNPALNFEAYPWAAFLWAYRHTGEREFLDRAKAGVGKTMQLYPHGWRWGDNMERARMLLPLAWLVRVEDTPQHRQWLRTVAADLIKNQVACGTIPEQLGGIGKGGGHYVVPASNEAYGTSETPLLQRNGDPVCDQLYTTGFALIGLHEAAAATGDAGLRRAEDRLADYLVRIQVRSPTLPYLDGAWFRAFDYEKWECWASSADMGWGAWSVEAGWAPAWAAATLGLRANGTSLWDWTSKSRITEQLPSVQREMAKNDGGPWAGR
jgi:hypothetical protein